jgi:hypothetical protein
MRYLFALLLTSCGWFGRDNEPVDHVADDIIALHDKAALYCELSAAKVAGLQYAVSECDGLLFTALHDLACGFPGISQFEEQGKWYRNPAHDCFPDKSASSISKDMYAGLLLHLAVKEDKETLKRTLDYCEANPYALVGCKVGEAKDTETLVSRAILPPTTISLMRDMLGSQRLQQGEEEASGVLTGYQGHLQVLGILTRLKVYGKATDREVDLLKAHTQREPENALYAASYGLFDKGAREKALSLLASDKYFPNDSLPSTENYCTHYLLQRDKDDKDWAPCVKEGEEPTIHDGTDFLFADFVARKFL